MAVAPVVPARAPGSVPCAATASVAALLDGPLRIGRVLADGPHALYVRVDDRVVAVVAATGVAVPIGLVTPWDRLPAHDGRVVAGHGALRVDQHHLHVARLVDRRVPDLPALADVAPASLQALDRRTGPARAELDDDALTGLAAGDTRSVDRLLGRGTGLTPTGDDVVAGWLVTRRAAGLPRDALAARTAELAPDATTAVSAALLSRALAGEAVAELADLLRAVAAHDDVEPAARRLAAVGHTSGAGMLLGAALALHPVRSTS